jgi:hypothetical protein
MPQDSESGGRAARWGRETADRIAQAIGASDLAAASNECILDGKRAVIKCAAAATDSVGVTYRMLGRLDTIVAAFQSDDDSFELWSLMPDQFRDAMRDSAGVGRGKTGLVRKDYFKSNGRALGRLVLPAVS